MKEYTVTLKSAEKVTPNILHLAFVRSDGETLEFKPGQFLTFLLDSADGVKRRSYSIASIPGKTTDSQIAISYQKDGVASEAMFNLKTGESLTCSGPFGRLVFRDNEAPARYFLVATGTGVAPYRSMLPQVAERLAADEKLEVHLLLGVQYRADLLYGEDFAAFAAEHPRFHFHAYFSRDELTAPQAHEHKGYVQNAFPDFNLDPDDDLVYLCGNPNMIDAAFAWLGEEGFSPRAVRREKYISSN
jgi:ferredoxin-NADP reductase